MISIRKKLLCNCRNIYLPCSFNDRGAIKTIIIRSIHKDKDIFSTSLKFETKVPQTPHQTEIFDQSTETNAKVKVDNATIKQLQKWSLVKLEDDKAIDTLEGAIEFANKILDVNTDGVEPLYTVLENRNLHLRSDKVSEGNCREDILSNAQVKEEYYFVAPPGNIPLEVEKSKPKREQEELEI